MYSVFREFMSDPTDPEKDWNAILGKITAYHKSRIEDEAKQGPFITAVKAFEKLLKVVVMTRKEYREAFDASVNALIEKDPKKALFYPLLLKVLSCFFNGSAAEDLQLPHDSLVEFTNALNTYWEEWLKLTPLTDQMDPKQVAPLHVLVKSVLEHLGKDNFANKIKNKSDSLWDLCHVMLDAIIEFASQGDSHDMLQLQTKLNAAYKQTTQSLTNVGTYQRLKTNIDALVPKKAVDPTPTPSADASAIETLATLISAEGLKGLHACMRHIIDDEQRKRIAARIEDAIKTQPTYVKAKVNSFYVSLGEQSFVENIVKTCVAELQNTTSHFDSADVGVQPLKNQFELVNKMHYIAILKHLLDHKLLTSLPKNGEKIVGGWIANVVSQLERITPMPNQKGGGSDSYKTSHPVQVIKSLMGNKFSHPIQAIVLRSRSQVQEQATPPPPTAAAPTAIPESLLYRVQDALELSRGIDTNKDKSLDDKKEQLSQFATYLQGLIMGAFKDKTGSIPTMVKSALEAIKNATIASHVQGRLKDFDAGLDRALTVVRTGFTPKTPEERFLDFALVPDQTQESTDVTKNPIVVNIVNHSYGGASANAPSVVTPVAEPKESPNKAAIGTSEQDDKEDDRNPRDDEDRSSDSEEHEEQSHRSQREVKRLDSDDHKEAVKIQPPLYVGDPGTFPTTGTMPPRLLQTNAELGQAQEKKGDCDCSDKGFIEAMGKKFAPKFKRKILIRVYEEAVYFKDKISTIQQKRLEPSIQKLTEHVNNLKSTTRSEGQSVINTDVEHRIIKSYRDAMAFYKNLAREVYQMHYDFLMKELGSKVKYIRLWRGFPGFNELEADLAKRRAEDLSKQSGETSGGTGVATDMKLRAATPTFQVFYAMMEDIRAQGRKHIDFIIENMQLTLDKIPLQELKGMSAEEEQLILREERNQTNLYMTKIGQKLSAIYNNEYSLMDIILDSEFITLYILKIIHYCFILLVMFLTEKIFSEMYMKAVYGKGGDPPDILTFIGIFLGLDVAMVLFMLTVLVMIMYLFKNTSNTFVINPHLLKNFIIDYIMSIVIITLFGIIVGMTIQKKRYFRYKTEGLRGIRALKEIVMSLAAIIIVIPFFILFQ